MPDIVEFTNSTREVQDLHADWWNPLYTTNGTPTGQVLEAGEPGGRYVERVVIYAEMYGADTQSIKSRQLRNVNIARMDDPKSAAELAKDRIHTYTRMVVEITNSKGVVIANRTTMPITEALIARMHERDLTFIDRAIEDLKKAPAVPVIAEDEDRSQKEHDEYERRLALGTPPSQLRTPQEPEEIAESDFR